MICDCRINQDRKINVFWCYVTLVIKLFVFVFIHIYHVLPETQRGIIAEVVVSIFYFNDKTTELIYKYLVNVKFGACQ